MNRYEFVAIGQVRSKRGQIERILVTGVIDVVKESGVCTE